MAILDREIQILMLKGEKGDAGDAGNYSTLSNKPSINSVELSGNKTASDLGLAALSDISGIGAQLNTNTTNIATLTTNMGDLQNLTTTNKTSIVNAINEANKPESFGNWQPTLSSRPANPGETSTAPTVTYGTRWGHYYKLGQMVYVTGRISFNITNKGTGYATISGLPFTASDAIFALAKGESYNAVETDTSNPTFYVAGNTSVVYIQNQPGAGANTWKLGTGSGSQSIAFSGVYLTGITWPQS